MKVLFLIPTKVFRDEPLGVMYLSSALKEAGHETELAIVGRDNPVKVAKKFLPDVLAFSIVTGMQKSALKINKQIKEILPSVFSAFGGAHCSFFPDFIKSEGVDGICRGEGEEALVDLVTALEKGKNITKIPNWWIKKGDSIFRNNVRPLLDLGKVHFPDRELLHKYKDYHRSKISYFLTSRGCPFECTYCFNHIYKKMYKNKGKVVRQRSVDDVIAEIKSVMKNKRLKFIYFVDDAFILSKKWLEEFAQKYPKEIGLPFRCNIRLDVATPTMIKKLASAGCIAVSAGLEAGNEKVRERILNRHIKREQIIKSSKCIKENGISLLLQNILGIPCTTLADDIETLDLNIICSPDYAWVSLYQPYPLTKLGELAKAKNYFKKGFNELPTTYHSKTVLDFKHNIQIEYLHKLFALAVNFPILKPIILKAIHAPNNRLIFKFYNLLFLGWKYYSYKKKHLPHF